MTIRLDPRLRYLTDLAARKQRRTVSGFIEWAIENALYSVALHEYNTSDGPTEETLRDCAEILWDPDEPDRFAKLGLHYPELLTHDEQMLWKLIRECDFLWRGRYDRQGRWTWKITPESLDFQKLREYWDTLVKVASGEADMSVLPSVPEHKGASQKRTRA